MGGPTSDSRIFASERSRHRRTIAPKQATRTQDQEKRRTGMNRFGNIGRVLEVRRGVAIIVLMLALLASAVPTWGNIKTWPPSGRTATQGNTTDRTQ
jgi:hypothetical protein